MKTLQELLNERAEKIQNQRTLIDAAKAENRDLTEVEAKDFDDLQAEIDGLEKDIEDKHKQEEREKNLAAREREINNQVKPFRPSMPSNHETQPSPKDDKGFQNFGEFISAVRFGDPKGRLSEVPINEGEGGGYEVPEAFRQLLLRNEDKGMSMGVGEKGGFAIPEQFRSEVLRMNPESMIVRPRASVIPAGDPPDSKITMPALDQGSNGVFGGVEVQWIGEGDDKPETDANLKEVSLEPKEVAATTVVTDKLLRNWKASNTFLGGLLRGAMDSAEDVAFLTGNGTAKPLGVTNGNGALSINRGESNKISYLDVVSMIAKLHPDSVSNALWVINQSALPQIVTLKDEAGNYIYIQGDASRGIPATLSGIPVRFTGKTKPLGTKGDIQLIDFGYYLIKDGSGPYVAASEHVLFRQNKTVIKAFWNVDGKPWVVEPLTLEDKSTKVSPYVVLDVPQG
ncbi:phage major capsid protein [Evansella cellulosilytica]|uniref:Phage major capsid protein, HK97 family n=1 Tax=Evansella cellulosilytica (strain ATCC 21833 / DSM 2522 / FERM P-1141 / JCM 9156 / N-4) TaxID=649639 RepID=E6TVG8_EVAC2|nr:phage major capsid protein [Evansella cellulosilytica]ADU30985.1 phage major capsid protein, HK97 family [Evansella cellulosilytica DSM 2522]